MNSTQHKINQFQVWLEAHPAVESNDNPDFLDAVAALDEALSAAYLAAFDLDEVEA